MGLRMNGHGWPPATPPRVRRERTEAAAAERRHQAMLGLRKREDKTSALANVSNAANKPQDAKVASLKSKMLNKVFLLDMMDRKKATSVKKEIESLGGTVVEFFGEGQKPSLIISDHPFALKLAPRDITNGKVKPEILKKMPMIMKEAVANQVRVVHVDQFWQRIADLKRKSPIKPVNNSRRAIHKASNVRRMSGPFIRFDDVSREFAPNIKEFRNEGATDSIYIGEYFGNSLFNKANLDQQERRRREIEDELNGDFDDLDDKKVPRPRSIREGFCEACNRQSSDLRLHFRSKEHLNIVNAKGFFDEVDALLGSYIPSINCPGKPLLRRRQDSSSLSEDSSSTEPEDKDPSYAYSESSLFTS